MDEAALLGASARERALYAELLALYRGLLAALDDGSADAAGLAAGRARADAVTSSLRAVAETLAPHRLTADAVAPAVSALWRESAELAVEALGANAELRRRAEASRAGIAAALGRIERSRTGLAGYRAAAAGARIADRHA